MTTLSQARERDAAFDAARDDAAGATFIDVRGPSEGHDICAGPDAWVNGVTPKDGVAAAYHPFAAEQAAIAELVERALQR